MIKVEHLAKTYTGTSTPAVDDVSFTVPQGGFYTLLGPSGCGKTTTLRCIAGLERPDGGDDPARGRRSSCRTASSCPTNRRDIGMVFQSYAVWPHMTVFENAAFPLRVGKRKVSKSRDRRQGDGALALVGLTGFEKRMATQLSGGQQQRLSLARALVREPTCSCSTSRCRTWTPSCASGCGASCSCIQRRVGITTLFVTHDQIEALSMSERIAVMDGGKIVQEGTPREIYHDPVNAFVAAFIGSTNLISGTGREPRRGTGLTTVETAAGPIRRVKGIAAGESVMVSIRPEEVTVHRGSGHAGDAVPSARTIWRDDRDRTLRRDLRRVPRSGRRGRGHPGAGQLPLRSGRRATRPRSRCRPTRSTSSGSVAPAPGRTSRTPRPRRRGRPSRVTAAEGPVPLPGVPSAPATGRISRRTPVTGRLVATVVVSPSCLPGHRPVADARPEHLP